MHKFHHHLHNFFIPHPGNNHLPYSVRHRNLWTYSGFLVGLKVLSLVLLFVSFPSIAQFSVITQSRIAELVNESRIQANLGAVTISPTLQAAAELKLADMMGNQYFAHTSPQGVEPWEWFRQAGYLYTYAGENLAMNFSEAEEAHEAWMDSPTHRANILNNNYQEMGLAVGVAEIDGLKATLVVQLFGASFVPPVLAQANTQVQGEQAASVPVSSAQADQPAFEQPGVENINNQPTGQASQPRTIQNPVQATPTFPTPSTRPVAVAPSPQAAALPAPAPAQPASVGPIDQGAASQVVTIESPAGPDYLGFILRLVSDFYLIILGFVILVLLLKIIIRVRIQHKRVIAHGLFVIAVGMLLLSIHLHFLESITGQVLVF